ncbi:MAG: PhoX family protein [Acidimicrobiia bacterium]|nr:PhoX family protein [Acidimicrobiia bacterium]
MSTTTRRMLLLASALLLGLATVAGPATAATGFLTANDPYITLTADAPAGSTVTAIISGGDQVGDFEFTGLPDGLGHVPGDGTVDVYVAHEETTVPFFGTANFQNASVSRLTLDTTTGAVLSAAVELSPAEGFLRFCSAFMAGPEHGFETYTFFVNEESNDIVEVPAGAVYGADPAFAPDNLRQGGYAIALRADGSEDFSVLAGLGRLNHENTVVVPAWENKKVILTTDDTFDGPSAQLYMSIANDETRVWDDKGSLWAFRVTATDAGKVDAGDAFNGANDYLDLQPGEVFQGEFIRVPKQIAEGQTGIAPQAALEEWSNANNVFQFIRLEDLAYDKNDPSVVYIADTGRSRVVPDPATGRMVRGPGGTVGLADNGSVFVMEFNEKNPHKVDAFYVLAQGDQPGNDLYVPFVSPDNMDTSPNSLMVQEDADNARIWHMDLDSGDWTAIATVNDPDGESSGILWAADSFGEGAWLLDVQAHGLDPVKEQVIDPTLTLVQEDGQLLIMRIPGS